MASVENFQDDSDSLLIETLNLDLEGLDDAEYAIPPVDSLPTLESILHEHDHTSLSEDEMSNLMLPIGEGNFEGSETASIGSIGNRSRSSSERRNPTATNKTPPNTSVLRHVILKNISAQLHHSSENINSGLPTAMAASTMIAIGTSHGLVLIFDSGQNTRWCFGDAQKDQQGSVSSLSFNHDCTRLLVGYARGQILMYDLTNGKLLRTMTDVHPPGTAVLHVKFTDWPTLALCSDSGGSVFELSFRRTLGVRGCDSKCLFSGSRGEVCTLEPLLLHQLTSHPLHGFVLVAMATLSKVIVVSIRPRLRVLFTHPLQSSLATLPLLAWQFVIIQLADTSKVVDPVLAFARQSTIFFYQVSVDSRNKVRFLPLQKVQVPYQLLSLHWLNARTLAVMDTLEQLRLLDVRTQEELESADLAKRGVALVYATSHFKGLSTGGNVSKAMALVGERACYNSSVSFGNQLLVLGTKTFHVFSIRTWNERLSHLIKQNRHLDALSLGMAIYLDKAKAVVGLKGPKNLRKEITKNKVIEMLIAFFEEKITESANAEFLQETIPQCVNHCVELNAMDLLFSKLWEAATTSSIGRSTFLESLAIWIESARINHVPPGIMQQLVGHFEKKGMLNELEACVVNLDVASLDIDQLVRLGKTHCLYDALIHIYNQALGDYITPLTELLHLLRDALATGKQLSDEQISLGNKLLVYISCCLAGRAYPAGDIPSSLVDTVKYEVFKCLTCLHSKDAIDSEPPYPYLRVLLHFDTKEFVNVLALAFEEPEFTSELGIKQIQRLIDILVLIMVQGQGFSPSQVGILFTFLARLLARPSSSSATTLHVDRGLFERVVHFLTAEDTDGGSASLGRHEERQQALLELIRAGGLAHYDYDTLLVQAKKAQFYRVCELIYEQRQEYDKILSCYLQDPLRRPQVFSYLGNILLIYNNSEDKVKVEVQVIENIKELLDIDQLKTGHIIYQHLSKSIPKIINLLESDPKVLYQFLEGVLQFKDTDPGFGNLRDELVIEPEMIEKYLALMCQFNVDKVVSFLTSSDAYRLDNALEITRNYNHSDATAYLLEKSGDYQAAMQLLLESLEDALANDNLTDNIRISSLIDRLSCLCQRGSNTLDEKGRQALWFPLLKAIMKPQRSKSKDYSELKAITHKLVTTMSGYVSLTAIIQLILEEPAYVGGIFGDIRPLIMAMLSNSLYEETLVETTFRILSHDLHAKMSSLLKSSARGIMPKLFGCFTCRKKWTATDSILLFRCGHSFHMTCLLVPDKCNLCMNVNSEALNEMPNLSKENEWFNSAAVTELNLQSKEFELKLEPPPPPDLEGIF